MRRYLFLSAVLLLLIPTQGCAKKKGGKHVIGFYNVENLFDTLHDKGKNDYEYLPDGANEWTADKYAVKQRNIARVLSDIKAETGQWHTVLGLAEVENRHVLEDLLKEPALADAPYKIVHFESPDRRGIDCALLYNPKRMKVVDTACLPYDFNTTIPITTYNKQEQADFRTRDALMVHGLIDGEHFAFYVCHFPSRRGDKGLDLRARAAEIVYQHAQQMDKKYPGIKCVVMGDMNDNPQDESLSVYLRGRRTVEEVQKGDFFNPFWVMLDNGIGSLYYRGNPNIFDDILVSESLVHAKKGSLCIQKQGSGYYGRVFEKPYMTQQSGPYKGTPFRTFSNGRFIAGYSDHYPTYIVLNKR
jgi:predicted extracellular nuclease